MTIIDLLVFNPTRRRLTWGDIAASVLLDLSATILWNVLVLS